jgi:hypothetical protein
MESESAFPCSQEPAAVGPFLNHKNPLHIFTPHFFKKIESVTVEMFGGEERVQEIIVSSVSLLQNIRHLTKEARNVHEVIPFCKL